LPELALYDWSSEGWVPIVIGTARSTQVIPPTPYLHPEEGKIRLQAVLDQVDPLCYQFELSLTGVIDQNRAGGDEP
jgi:hypothetical protein